MCIDYKKTKQKYFEFSLINLIRLYDFILFDFGTTDFGPFSLSNFYQKLFTLWGILFFFKVLLTLVLVRIYYNSISLLRLSSVHLRTFLKNLLRK